MTKNKLEKLFSKSKGYFDWCVKLHNNPLSHQNTPADYIASHKRIQSAIPSQNYNEVILFECKQVTCKDGKGRLAFSRLKQLHDLLAFKKLKPEHRAYFVIAFWDKSWANSDLYLIDVELMANIIRNSDKVSVNRTELFNYCWVMHHLLIENGEIRWKDLF